LIHYYVSASWASPLIALRRLQGVNIPFIREKFKIVLELGSYYMFLGEVLTCVAGFKKI